MVLQTFRHWQRLVASAWVVGALGLATGGWLGCQRAEPRQPLQWRTALPGLEYARTHSATSDGHTAAAVHLLRFDLRRFELAVVRGADFGRPLADAAAFREQARGVAAINAGYFDPQYKPLGLLVSGGRELAHLRRVDHGVFAIAAGRAFVEHARAWQAPPDLQFAVECGPRLLVAGRAQHFRKDDLARRVAIGRDGEGRVVLAVSDGVVSLANWAITLGQRQDAGGPQLTDALNLDGGSSAMLDIAAGDLRVGVATAVQVPIGLAVVARLPPETGPQGPTVP